MNLKKKCQVLMLGTEKASKLYLDGIDNLLKPAKYLIEDNSLLKNQHLYIISDDEIKEGDWYYDDIDSIIPFIAQRRGIKIKSCSKIIATTDSLNQYWSPNSDKYKNSSVQLPQLSPQFIQKYIKCYNKGEIIADVMIEYNHPHDWSMF